MLITNRFNVTVVDDSATDPIINQTVNFTDDSFNTPASIPVTLTAAGTGDWTDNGAVQLFSLPSGKTAKYIVIQPTKPIYCFLSDPGQSPGTPVFTINNVLVLSGDISTIWAISSVAVLNDHSTTSVQVIYVY